MVQKPESDTEPRERRIDLSLPQVAGSAVAAVAAAVAASQLGVYGTILGAGVMSIVATCGGSVFQHFFRRTGEQIREVTVQVKHPGREVTVHTRQTRDGGDPDARWETSGTRVALREAAGSADATAMLRPLDATTVLRQVDPADMPVGGTAKDADATTVLRQVDATTVLRKATADPDRTRLIESTAGTRQFAGAPASDDAFTRATTHGTRIRGWKRSALGAAVVFVVSMIGITTFELVSGNDLSGGHGTTVGSVVRGERGSGSSDPAPSTGTDPEQDATTPGEDDTTAPGADRQDGRSTNPDPDRDGASTTEPTPTPTPSESTGADTAPPPAPSPTTGDGNSSTPDPTGTGSAPAQEGDAPAGTDTGE
ncbi:hypothetical protein [Streptomyces poriferorum]|uniref:Uncharacterized protein n=1 Tax=Streptomyces poriferorum TaxID=2798799 RepID=A0ABY9INE7_9ACTN|nr:MULTISPECIES: hypothetical protein [unclassified Streptomyces]MDP5315264.1 hypothetical protein [Streptomyces sp. Alt4]WLQ55874.1 hypothetical protein P8A19_10635 [Streptomyces sp. Alt2]